MYKTFSIISFYQLFRSAKGSLLFEVSSIGGTKNFDSIGGFKVPDANALINNYN